MALATRSGAPAHACAAGFLANESCAFIDTLFCVAEAGGCKFAADVSAAAPLCRATLVEERFWSALARVQHRPRRRTVLMHASARGDVARVSWLLARGAPRDAQNADGWTALFYASSSGHADAVRALVAGGAGVHVTAIDGATPLILASFSGTLDAVRALLAAGASVHAKDSHARTALHWACIYGYDLVARALLEAGANVNARDSEVCTPLHYASACNHLATASALLLPARTALCSTTKAERRETARRPTPCARSSTRD
jgi:ankyrin repeat protein